MPTPRLVRRTLTVAAALLGLSIGLAAPAFAHVEATGSTDADGSTTVTFTFHHGCSGSPTTSFRVQLPTGTTKVEAQNPSGWTSKTSDTEIAWTGGPLPDGDTGEFTASMQLTATAGETVAFPAVQGCEKGENAWIQPQAPGQPEPEYPAPQLTVGAATGGAHDHDAGTSSTVTTQAGEHDHDGGDDSGTTVATTGTTKAPGTTVGTTAKPAGTAPGTTVAPATNPSSSNSGLLIGIAIGVIVIAVIVGIVVSRGRAGPSGSTTTDQE